MLLLLPKCKKKKNQDFFLKIERNWIFFYLNHIFLNKIIQIHIHFKENHVF